MPKNKQKEKTQKKSFVPIIKFLSIFIGIISAYYIILAISDDSIFQSYLNFTANIGSIIINIVGEKTSAESGIISSDSVSMVLAFGCEGTEPIIILIAGLLAIPIPNKKLWLPGLISIISLYFLNIIRIAVLYFIQKGNPSIFDSYHTVYFPILFILISLIMMAGSIKWASKK
ncbi:MAG TPA: exosortase/archaeosortase family protein [Candidatus Kapabacteria bacterium]|nr:exosortase/archaeosortase family protein [Candidatus Kapabacteria bacterium]